MVMFTAHVVMSLISVSSKMNLSTQRLNAMEICWICWATTESTSREMRLNSSKQHQQPEEARPLKNFPSCR